ncbi:hypothetical protein H4P12_04550 [Paracoccus sp. 11-3]|uniref:Uncharacterized protein n=1 Tax=Paracoccus amoyensis TaxID=2760093 RepID=A0A926GF80_9RHOB|nr:hypothetical protein [Paracoccus amoyensis]MBC9245997.1 hypothetical protein [Paracoccus amoyensis]
MDFTASAKADNLSCLMDICSARRRFYRHHLPVAEFICVSAHCILDVTTLGQRKTSWTKIFASSVESVGIVVVVASMFAQSTGKNTKLSQYFCQIFTCTVMGFAANSAHFAPFCIGAKNISGRLR